MTGKQSWKRRSSKVSKKSFMDPTVLSKKHVRWRAMKLINVESVYLAPRDLAGAHPDFSCRDSGVILGAGQIYETLLRTGKAKKTCTACNRHLNDQEMTVFENYVRAFGLRMNVIFIILRPYQLQEQMKRTSPEKIKQEQEELKGWQMELTDVQRLLSVEATKNKLVAREIPELEQSVKEKQKEVPLLTEAVNNVRFFVGRGVHFDSYALNCSPTGIG